MERYGRGDIDNTLHCTAGSLTTNCSSTSAVPRGAEESQLLQSSSGSERVNCQIGRGWDTQDYEDLLAELGQVGRGVRLDQTWESDNWLGVPSEQEELDNINRLPFTNSRYLNTELRPEAAVVLWVREQLLPAVPRAEVTH